MSALPLVRIWLVVSAFASVAGWMLSAVGQLNRAGYVILGLVVVLLLLLRGDWLDWVRARASRAERLAETEKRQKTAVLQGAAASSGLTAKSGSASRTPFGSGLSQEGARVVEFSSRAPVSVRRAIRWAGVRRRFGRWLPASFVLLALLVFLGGALYPPTNHTGLTYRTPRVLQWLTEGHWFWIHSPNYRMNDRACGLEWLSAPPLLFTKSDRGIFLLNFFPFLLLPGLIFSAFKRLGVRGRVAWHWMWLLPTGYTFLLQAGSIGNDTFPTVYALAAVDFGLRAWESRRLSDLWLSVLAAGLLTGAKASNLPLLLPWAILMLGFGSALERRPLASAGVLLVTLLVSFLPTAVLNVIYCGDWSGPESGTDGNEHEEPIRRDLGQCLSAAAEQLRASVLSPGRVVESVLP